MKTVISLDRYTEATLLTDTDVPRPYASPMLQLRSDCAGTEGLGGSRQGPDIILAGKEALAKLLVLLQQAGVAASE